MKLWKIIAFFMPPVAFILFLAWRKKNPKDARTCLKMAIWGFIIGTILGTGINHLIGAVFGKSIWGIVKAVLK